MPQPFENGFPIDELLLPWGTTLLEVASRTAGREWQRAEGEPSLRGACQSVFGIATTACFLRAPAPFKPVMQVSYQLAAPPPHLNGAATLAYWLMPLRALLGPPATPANRTGPSCPERGALLFWAEWRQGWQHLSLGVYRALGAETDGPTATLTLAWEDVLTAALPYLAKLQEQENLLTAALRLPMTPKLFELNEVQPRPETSRFAESATPESLLRQAQWALHHTGLYQTPAALRTQLSERQVCLWLTDLRGPWALSTSWSTVLLPGDRGPGPHISLVVTHPAKGAGFQSLQVGDLVLYDTYQSPVLGQLAAALELWGYATVVCSDSSDC